MKNEGKFNKVAKWVIIFVVLALVVLLGLLMFQKSINRKERNNKLTDNRDKYIESLLSNASNEKDYKEIEKTIDAENYIPEEDYFNMGENGYSYLKSLFKTDYNYVEIEPMYIQPIVTIFVEDLFSKKGIDENGLNLNEYIIELKDTLKSLENTDYPHTRIKLRDDLNEIQIEWNVNSKGLNQEKPILVIPFLEEDGINGLELLDDEIKVVDGKVYTTEDFNKALKKEKDVIEPVTVLLKEILSNIKDNEYFRINIVDDTGEEINTFRFCVSIYTQTDFVYIQDNVKSLNKIAEQYRYLYRSGSCSEGFLGNIMSIVQ